MLISEFLTMENKLKGGITICWQKSRVLVSCVKSFEMVTTNKLRHDDDCWTTEDVGNGSRNSYDEGYDVSEEEQIGH